MYSYDYCLCDDALYTSEKVFELCQVSGMRVAACAGCSRVFTMFLLLWMCGGSVISAREWDGFVCIRCKTGVSPDVHSFQLMLGIDDRRAVLFVVWLRMECPKSSLTIGFSLDLTVISTR